ncbi:hypothetical protein PFICI_12553 [Pestalotiopsis fici W106-1]|uniref:SMP-30/Gluconolactonase/LRE-like region domain-containing protein n=1 Tax=Pestalotiopsis fici (strain W106-1 / CGMCC3.15140) TaxID=1229662 RepID=W3WP77_PESFW|nr:uncharacterized protein PFICI_12553 [Pestalotiopsis fici W106-1]ETS75609.1 hypothetical protein PFICI_12553 [Pestalotiopsis fici W106-1]
MAGTLATGVATLIFSLTGVNFENSIVRPNGNLLLTTINNGSLYEIDPSSASPAAHLTATFGGANVLGISSIGSDKYAIAGGFSSGGGGGGGPGGYSNGTIFTIDLSTNSTLPLLGSPAATIPDSQLLDGLTALPAQPHVLLVTDALQGLVYRVDTATGAAEVAAQDDAFAGSPGVNGIKILDGHAYFTNTATKTYGRFAISDDGLQAGAVEIIAEDASSDDFALGPGGMAYLGRQQSPAAVVRILPDGTKEDIATSAAMGRPCSLDLALDGKTGYVTTASGQVFEFDVPEI